MKLFVKYAKPGSGNINVFASLKHLKPSLLKCEVNRVNSRPTLVMVPTGDKLDTFVAPCCYLAFECIGPDQKTGVKIILTAVFPNPMVSSGPVIAQPKTSRQAQEISKLVELCHRNPYEFDRKKSDSTEPKATDHCPKEH